MNLISWTNHSFLFSKKDYYCQSQVEFPPTSSLRRGGDVFDGKFRFRDVSKTKSSIEDASLPLKGGVGEGLLRHTSYINTTTKKAFITK